MNPIKLPAALLARCRQHSVRLTKFIFTVNIAKQRGVLFQRRRAAKPEYAPVKRYVLSTSRYGIGSVMGSNKTPLGLHRVAKKIGGRYRAGAVFKSRKLIGYTWDGMPDAAIAHRILWLDGLEPGRNRGGKLDTFARYVYIHGVGDETTLGRPASCGCIHLGAEDLLPFYRQVPKGTLVWIAEQ